MKSNATAPTAMTAMSSRQSSIGSWRGSRTGSRRPGRPRARRGRTAPRPAAAGGEHQRAGDRRAISKPEDHRERGGADEHGRPVTRRGAQPGRELAPSVVTFGGRAGELGSSPTTMSSGSGRKPVTTALERRLAIQPMRRRASSRSSRPVASAIAATLRRVPARSITSTAPPATAASDELGPSRLPGHAEKRVDDRPRQRRRPARSATGFPRCPRTQGSAGPPGP